MHTIKNIKKYVNSNKYSYSEILCVKGMVTTYMPPYHNTLDKEYNKLLSDGQNYKQKEYNEYWEKYVELKKHDEWNFNVSKAIAMQNNHQYFIDNPNRKCLKCSKMVTAGSNNCLKINDDLDIDHIYINDPTKTEYYLGDIAASQYEKMFKDMFNLCLAKYPRGDTLKYSDERISFNSDIEENRK
jgi:hypothetical protein